MKMTSTVVTTNNSPLCINDGGHTHLIDSSSHTHATVTDSSGQSHGNVVDSSNMFTGFTQQTNFSPNNNNNNVKQCAGCGAKIIDRFLLHAMDRYWHTGCLKCSCCEAQLGEIGQTCFTRNGMILCKNDYLRMFGSPGQCWACHQPIPAQEFVMKADAHVYHVHCFTCVVCRCKLVRGDRYSIYQGCLLCEHDFPKVVRGNTQIAPHRGISKVC